MVKQIYAELQGWMTNHLKVIRNHPISFFLLILGIVHALLLFYPGSLSVDSRNQLNQAMIGRYDDWHPPVMAWLWRHLLWFKSGPQPMLWFHLLLFWGGLYLIWYSLAKKHLWTRSLVPLIGFMPPVISMVGVIWKDIGLGACSLLIVGIWISEFKNEKIRLLLLWPLLIYSSWVRHNALGLTGPFIFSMPFQFTFSEKKRSSNKKTKKKKPENSFMRKFFFATTLLVSVSALRLLFENVFLSTNHSYAGSYLQLFDLASIEDTTGASLIPESYKTQFYSKKIISRYLYDRDPSQLIFIRDAQFYIRPNSGENSELQHIWLKSVIQYLPSYLTYRWFQYKSLIGWGYGQCRANHFYMPEDYGGGIAWMKQWRDYLNEKTTYWAATTPVFSGWFYLALAGIGLFASFFLKSDYQVIARLCFLSTLLYSATYFVGSVSCDFRYVWPTTLTSVLGWILLLSQLPDQRGSMVNERGVNL